jgi:hypothetical protein
MKKSNKSEKSLTQYLDMTPIDTNVAVEVTQPAQVNNTNLQPLTPASMQDGQSPQSQGIQMPTLPNFANQPSNTALSTTSVRNAPLAFENQPSYTLTQKANVNLDSNDGEKTPLSTGFKDPDELAIEEPQEVKAHKKLVQEQIAILNRNAKISGMPLVHQDKSKQDAGQSQIGFDKKKAKQSDKSNSNRLFSRSSRKTRQHSPHPALQQATHVNGDNGERALPLAQDPQDNNSLCDFIKTCCCCCPR